MEADTVSWKSQLMLSMKRTHNILSTLSALVCVFYLGENTHVYTRMLDVKLQ